MSAWTEAGMDGKTLRAGFTGTHGAGASRAAPRAYGQTFRRRPPGNDERYRRALGAVRARQDTLEIEASQATRLEVRGDGR